MKLKTWVEVSESALQANVRILKGSIGEDVCLLGVIKANAYGAGIETVIDATESFFDWYGVDSLDEAIKVRARCQNKILILGYVAIEDVAEVLRQKASVAVYTYDLVVALSNATTKECPARVHIKIDTCLARLGLWPEDAVTLAKKISKLPNIIVEGLYTHYAKLIDENHIETYSEQLEKFNFVVDSLMRIGIRPKLLHTASSMAAVLYKETRFNMVRMGIPIYGFWGRESSEGLLHEKGVELILHPVITWKTTIVNIKKIPANTGIGYGYSEVVSRETTVAVLGAGFSDGIDKRYGKVGHVLINGKRAKVLGGVAMNMCMVDATDVEDVNIGDIAVLIGRSDKEEITAYEFAKVINTSTYEIISRINPLLPRVLVS